MIYDTFQYVSVKKTLQSLMQNRAFVEMTLQDKCTPGVLQEFVDGGIKLTLCSVILQRFQS